MEITSTEMEIKVLNGRITSTKALICGTCRITAEVKKEDEKGVAPNVILANYFTKRSLTEMEIKVSNGRITSAEILRDDTCKITAEVKTEDEKAVSANLIFKADFLKPTPYEKKKDNETARLETDYMKNKETGINKFVQDFLDR